MSETMDALEAHDTALLISQGFDAACPYVIWETVMNGDVIKWQEADVDKRLKNVEKSMEMSLKKIMAKMGIFAVDGYRGGCFFEALGIDGKVSKKYLPNNVSQIGGMDFDDMVEDQLARLQEGRKSLRKIKEPTSRKGRVFGFLNAFLLNPKKSELKLGDRRCPMER
ncbi:hypothetical protein HYW82_03820 [Candidatus Peregrinibacteria bacterium]|nr:hypothetical protein [Candidatus Peregrinibacteria bacterium]